MPVLLVVCPISSLTLKEQHERSLLDTFYVSVANLLDNPDEWSALAPTLMTNENLSVAFAMCTRAACGINQLMRGQA